jgi:hypothetical protein
MNYNENIILNCNSFLWKKKIEPEKNDVMGWERNSITRIMVIGIRRKIRVVMFVQRQ